MFLFFVFSISRFIWRILPFLGRCRQSVTCWVQHLRDCPAGCKTVSHLLNQSYFSCPFHGILWLLKLRFEVYTHTFTHTCIHVHSDKQETLTRAYGPFVAFPRCRYIPWRKLCFWLTNLYNIHECENATHCNKAPCKKGLQVPSLYLGNGIVSNLNCSISFIHYSFDAVQKTSCVFFFNCTLSYDQPVR